MAKAVQKITLSSSRDIPFNKLVLSQSNVRRVKSGVSVEELAESIARRGLIQSLHVRPVLNAEGQETGMFEVPAGGRRYRALELLAKQKRLAKTAPVPCVVGDVRSGILVDEVSLVENIERVPLHPLDQFRAFEAMRDKGMTEEAIAAAFFIDVHVVKQRLRLAAVSPALLEVYAEDGMTLEQLMAFTVTQDHARQEQIWEAIRGNWQKEPWQIRRMLTETTVSASDKRALVVGVAAYEAAGGVVLRDLFQIDEAGWLQDVGLLDRLVAEKLKVEADKIATEGWKWVDTTLSMPYCVTRDMRKLVGTPIEMSESELAKRSALQAELNRLIEANEGADELPEEIDQRICEVEAEIEALDNRPRQYDPAEIAIAGVFITIDPSGSLIANRGYVRPEDELAIQYTKLGDQPNTIHKSVSSLRQIDHIEDEEEDGIKPLPERLVLELTTQRTLALCDALAQHPQIAMTALLYKLVTDAFRRQLAGGALDVQVRKVCFPVQTEDLGNSLSAKSIDRRHEDWNRRIPDDDAAIWAWLSEMDDANRLDLLAHCVSYAVNALHERPYPYSNSGISEHGLQLRFSQADRLARATGLNMVQAGWRPTVRNYLGRVTKSRIREAVREGAGERALQLIDNLNKGDMAREAERLLADTGWLPAPLCLAHVDETPQHADEQSV